MRELVGTHAMHTLNLPKAEGTRFAARSTTFTAVGFGSGVCVNRFTLLIRQYRTSPSGFGEPIMEL